MGNVPRLHTLLSGRYIETRSKPGRNNLDGTLLLHESLDVLAALSSP